jgi:hypothetical protein
MVDVLVDRLNDIIMDLRDATDYNNHRDEMHALLIQISGHFDDNNGTYLKPEIRAIYANLPANITLDNQVGIIHNLWELLQLNNFVNWETDSQNSQASEREYVPPHDFFPLLIESAHGRLTRKRNRKGRKGRKGTRRKGTRRKRGKGKKSSRVRSRRR